MSAADIPAIIAELRDMAERATALAYLLSASGEKREPRPPVEPEPGEVVTRGPEIDSDIQFSHTDTAGF